MTKMIETLTDLQKIDLLNGSVVGIFDGLFVDTDEYFNLLQELCFGYYIYRSGDKIISPIYERCINLVNNNSSINKTPEELITNLLRSKFSDKWKKVYNSIIKEEYNPLQDYVVKEIKNGNNTETKTYGSNISKTGNNTDNTTYDTSVVDNGKTGTKEVVTRNTDNSEDFYGFNSSTPVGDNVSNEIFEETTVGNADENTTYNKQDKTGTENKTFGINENEAKTGTDNNTFGINETIEKSGRNTNGAELVQKEIDMRNKVNFFDIVYSDIDSIVALGIYL